jgi:signal transduction histidine kinase
MMKKTDNCVTQLEDELRILKAQLRQEQEKNKQLLAGNEMIQTLNAELQATSEELTATNEELAATNEEFSAITEELHKTNTELQQYRTQLELMVENKTKELTVSQENLLSLSHRQALFIKVLQILQLENDLPTAMNMAIAEIGEYTGVSRMQIWENNPDGLTYGVSYEWCNEGVEPAIHYLKNILVEYGKPWFEMLLSDRIICTSDISTLHPAMIEILSPQGVKSIVVLPLAEYGVFFGYISFTVTEERVWETEDLGLLKNIAQIVSTASKRYQAETVIKQSQQVMRTVLDNINSNIFVVGYETMKILFANKAFKQETGEDVEGKICWQALNAGLACECEHCPKSLLFDEKKRPRSGVHLWEDYNPFTKRWYTIASTAFEWVDGHVAILELATDVTERKMAEIELVRAREKAEESDILKSAFLANMSHEIRTPINGITGFVQFLNDEKLPPHRRQEYINIINSSSAQLVKLIDDIIDVAKIEARQMNINPIPVNINNLMTELHLFFETFMKSCNKGHISLVLDESKFIDNCIAFVDATRLRQLITNLITNAIKYTDKGYIHFGYRQSSPDKLEFVVEDSGIGLKPDQHEIIFERFRQAEHPDNRQQGGTGLGLSISRSLVQLMGGQLWVESVEGEGSSFFFTITYLPVTPENGQFFTMQTNEAAPGKPAVYRKALVVEPEIMKFKYIEKFLSAAGFAAIQAVNITQGFEHMSEKTCVDAMIINKTVLTQTSDEEIRQIKSICACLQMIILIGDAQNEVSLKNCTVLEEPINYEELMRLLKGLEGSCTINN